MRKFVMEGNLLDLIAPAGGVVAGEAYKIGLIIAVAATTAAAGAAFAGSTEGVYDLTAEGAGSGQDLAVGDIVYYDATNKRMTKTVTSNSKAGYAVAAKASTATSVRIRLVPTI